MRTTKPNKPRPSDQEVLWREEARVRAIRDLEHEGLTGEAATKRFHDLYNEAYRELARAGAKSLGDVIGKPQRQQ